MHNENNVRYNIEKSITDCRFKSILKRHIEGETETNYKTMIS